MGMNGTPNTMQVIKQNNNNNSLARSLYNLKSAKLTIWPEPESERTLTQFSRRNQEIDRQSDRRHQFGTGHLIYKYIYIYVSIIPGADRDFNSGSIESRLSAVVLAAAPSKFSSTNDKSCRLENSNAKEFPELWLARGTTRLRNKNRF